jgi:o-succinylbenzoate synthase
MKLLGVEVRQLELEFRAPISSAVEVHGARPVLMLRVVSDGPDGWGECGALRAGTAVDPSIDTMWRSLVDWQIPAFVEAVRRQDAALPPASAVRLLFGERPQDRMGLAALEMAILDAELREADRALGEFLSVDATDVTSGALVGIPEARDVGRLLDEVDYAVERGFSRIRLKLAPGWDLVPVAAVRSAYPDLALQGDANGSYRWDAGGASDATALASLDVFDLVCIEQPLGPDDLRGHAELARRLATPVGLDESLHSPRRLQEAIATGACEVACLKPARLGGLFAAREAQQIAASHGVPAFVGGFFETGLARSANAALSGLAGCTLPGDLCDPGDYLLEDPCGYLPVLAGQVSLSTSAGVGQHPIGDCLKRRSSRLAWIGLDG